MKVSSTFSVKILRDPCSKYIRGFFFFLTKGKIQDFFFNLVKKNDKLILLFIINKVKKI